MKPTHELLRDYVARFNADDEESVINEIPNAKALAWMEERVPRIAVPDAEIERAYYFRWWTYRKHICDTPEGHVLTEFSATGPLPWAHRYSAISCAAGHHVNEGQWLRETGFLEEYIRFWYRYVPALRSYGNWLESAVGNYCRLKGDRTLAGDVLPGMVQAYAYAEEHNAHPSGLFFSIDDRDGQEYSVAGSGLRPTMNCYLYAAARTIAETALCTGDGALAREYARRAEVLRDKINTLLWDEDARFYKTLPMRERTDPVPAKRPPRFDAREIIGFFPWAFGAAPEGRADAFAQLLDADGFYGRIAPPVCERRHPDYLVAYTAEEYEQWLHRYEVNPYGKPDPAAWQAKKARGERLASDAYGLKACQWNGPSWAHSTSVMLEAAANLLADYAPQDVFTKADYLNLLHRYAASHRRTREDGSVVSWIDEAQDPDTGEWITRRIYYDRRRAHPEAEFPAGIDRGKDYNHSCFCHLVLGGLFGIRPGAGKSVRIVPLFPDTWEYAGCEDVPVRGRLLSVRYRRGEGYRVEANGETLFESAVPEKCEIVF